jgi:hypothetical protein
MVSTRIEFKNNSYTNTVPLFWDCLGLVTFVRITGKVYVYSRCNHITADTCIESVHTRNPKLPFNKYMIRCIYYEHKQPGTRVSLYLRA